MKLNLNLINTIFSSNNYLKEEEKKKLIEKLKNIEILFDRKVNLIKEKKKINSKILMDNQIFEENKRTKNENLLSYKDQYEEIKGNSIRKEVEGQDVLNAIDPGQLLIKIVHDEITDWGTQNYTILKVFLVVVKYICPLFILFIFLHQIGWV